MPRSERVVVGGWFEEYRCGCISDTVRRKRDLPGILRQARRRFAWASARPAVRGRARRTRGRTGWTLTGGS